MFSVLVFTPVFRLEPETIKSIFDLDYDSSISCLFQKQSQGCCLPSGGHQNILFQYQQGRRVFLAGPYDYMFVVESDIIVPRDALKKLMALNADLAYGVYAFRQTPESINVFERYPGRARNVGEPLTAHPDRLRAALEQGVVDCSGAGLGCVLIKRHVLEAIDFRREENGPHCDSYFTEDCYRFGYTMKADLSVICGHKGEDGVILWPRF